MPKGTFVILIPLDADYKVLGYFNKSKSIFEITSDLFLRLNLDHSKNEYNLLKLKDYQIFSYIYNFKGKLTRKASGIIIGLLLDEKPDIRRRAGVQRTRGDVDVAQRDRAPVVDAPAGELGEKRPALGFLAGGPDRA